MINQIISLSLPLEFPYERTPVLYTHDSNAIVNESSANALVFCFYFSNTYNFSPFTYRTRQFTAHTKS